MGSRRIAIGLATMTALLAGLVLETTGSRAGVGVGTGSASIAGQTVVGTPDPDLESPPNDMGHNGLSSASLFNNALTMNPKALKALLNHSLNSDIFNNKEYPELKYQLLDPHARDVMEDLVRCALGPKSPVVTYSYTDIRARINVDVDFHGELGLCTTGPDDWRSQPPSEKCQQLVTACLLARVNALHLSVPISLRSSEMESNSIVFEDVLPTRMHVFIEKTYRESPKIEGLSMGTLIGSFADYLPSRPSVASARSANFPILTPPPPHPICAEGTDCGWKQAYIGTCSHGTYVDLNLQGECDSIRVCSGITGCESNSSRVPPRAHRYSMNVKYTTVAQQKNICSLKFACPSPVYPGLATSTYGTYGVMIKPSSGGLAQLTAISANNSAGSGKYPARETDVFPFREGAFFGNLFEPNELTRTRAVIIENGEPMLSETSPVSSALSAPPSCQSGSTTVIPYQHVYACYSLIDQKYDSKDIQLNTNDGVANFDGRTCVQGTSGGCYPPCRRCL